MTRIPEIIDNRTNLLGDTINHLLKYSTKVEIAAGYFYLSGFNLVSSYINENCIINIVIGNETDRITASEITMGYESKKNSIIDSLCQEMKEDLSDEQKERIFALSELIRQNRVHFKIYVKDKFHSKAYIFDVSYNQGDTQEEYAIVGSSNFSKRGLGSSSGEGINTELNAVIRQTSAITEVREWFYNIWEEAEEFNGELLKIIDQNLQLVRYEYSPFDILLKSLFELLKDDNTFDELESLYLDDLTEFQAYAVKKAIHILNKYNGLIIADSVGLGKTYVAKGLLRHFNDNELDTLIICPASLKPMWERETALQNMQVTIISQESIGRDGIELNIGNNAKVVIIDEAHNFRNENANRHKELIKMTMGKKIVQLTATPVNNSIFDLYNLLTLFIKEDEFKSKYGIPRLKEIFNNYDLYKDKITNVLNEIMIRRSRTFIKKKYENKAEALIVNGQPIKFPKRHLQKISYDISKVYNDNLFKEIAGLLEGLYLPIISEEKLSDVQMAYTKALIKTMFLKRFESSVEAFSLSIEKQIKYCDILLDSIDNGFLISKSSIMEDLESDNFNLNEDHQRIDLSSYKGNIENLIENIKSDKQSFEYILTKIINITDDNDAKLQTLIGFIQDNLKGKKILIFTQFKDTARYLYKNLLDTNLGYVEEIDSKNNRDNRKEKIVAQFSPLSNNSVGIFEKEIDILVSTDILSEGQNLQDCNIIINYDLAWNPVRIIQREGRIDRITTVHDNIYIYSFIPDDKLEEILNLTKRLAEKIKYINETVGNESKILSNEEILIDKVYNEKEYDQVIRISEGDSTLLDELEENRDELIPSEEYIYEDYKELILRDEENLKKVKAFEDGIFTVRYSDKYKGMFMYYKAKSENFWLYFNQNDGTLISSKAEIYNIISCGDNMNTKPVKRSHNFDINSILEQGKLYVQSVIQNIIQTQMASNEIDMIQKVIAGRIEDIFLKVKFRSRITSEQRSIRKKLKEPLHKGTILKLRSLEIEKMTDDQLMQQLDQILEYINLETKDSTFTNDFSKDDIKLICYELFL